MTLAKELLVHGLLEGELGTKKKWHSSEVEAHVWWAYKAAAIASEVGDRGALLPSAILNIPEALCDEVSNCHTWDGLVEMMNKVNIGKVKHIAQREQCLRALERRAIGPAPDSPTKHIRMALARTTIAVQPPIQPLVFNPVSIPVTTNTGGTARGVPSCNRTYTPITVRYATLVARVLKAPPNTAEGQALYAKQKAGWQPNPDTQGPDENHLYPLTPGTVDVGSNECYNCGMQGHQSGACRSTKGVPDLERTWRQIAGYIIRTARKCYVVTPDTGVSLLLQTPCAR
ncbi:hypothetical protein DAEQUDRAFT_770904 [Daedalea quercina L-15889]|uniref:CCHC-type domain-containing protein n=1 Tax=Daedalea quercina L-15889 TaxID=1314783 RepID=A0A165KGU7_9APHY|nr:hypothetical protein DAEQUDRAFT_770904 [Daedalea quercina L-15889]